MLDKGLSLIIEKLNPVLVYVFGSFARGELREDSDIDLAFLSDGEFTSYEIFMLAQEIAEIYNREVDLIDLKKASTVFKAQIVGTGDVIYCSDENIKTNFQKPFLRILFPFGRNFRPTRYTADFYAALTATESCFLRINLYGSRAEAFGCFQSFTTNLKKTKMA